LRGLAGAAGAFRRPRAGCARDEVVAWLRNTTLTAMAPLAGVSRIGVQADDGVDDCLLCRLALKWRAPSFLQRLLRESRLADPRRRPQPSSSQYDRHRVPDTRRQLLGVVRAVAWAVVRVRQHWVGKPQDLAAPAKGSVAF
jgi:hypothetical protein